MDLHLYATTLSRDRAIQDLARQFGCVFDHRHFAYAELSERLYRSEGLPGRLIERPAQTLLARHSLIGISGQMPSPGLVAEYRSLIDELKGAGVAAANFSALSELLDPTLPHHTRQIVEQLLAALSDYQQCLDRAGLVDQGDRDLGVIAQLRQHLRQGTRPALLCHVRRLVVHDVYHLSLVHYALLSMLLKLVDEGGELHHFSSGLNLDAVTFAEYTWQRFVADESLADLVLPEFARPRPRGGNLEALSERLFTNGPTQPMQADGSLTVVAAPGRAREVEIIARRIRGLLEAGVAAEQIAIIVRNLEHYGDLLTSTCQRYRIPLWFRRGVPLFHVPLTKIIFSLLELADSTYPRPALLKLLNSAYLRPESAWPDDVVGLVSAVGYLDRHYVPLSVLLRTYIQRQRPDETQAHKIEALASWVETLQTVLDDLVEHPRSFLAYLETLKLLLDQWGLFRAMGMHPEVPLAVIQRDRDAMRLIFDTLWSGAEVWQLLGNAALSFADFRLLAIDLLRDVSLDQPLPSAGAVRILGVHDVLGLEFDHVFLPGLADTEFPRHYAEHPVLGDSARRAMNGAARQVLMEKFAGILDRRLLGKILLTTAERAREEPLLFFLALEAANRTCVLSYPTRTADGEALFASMFVDEVLRHFPAAAPVVERPPALPSVPLASQCLEPGELLRRVALSWDSTAGRQPQEATALEAMLRSRGTKTEHLRALASVEQLRKAYLLGSNAAPDLDPAPFGDIGRQIDLRQRFLDPQRPWSPTMLEDAAACPFAFFSKHVLRLLPRREPDYDFSPATLGELAHGVLAAFFQTDPPSDASAAVQHMRTLAERLLTAVPQNLGRGHPGFWQVRKTELLAVLDDLATYLASRQLDIYRTYSHECDLAAVVLCAPWSVALTGRVDRVAVWQGASGVDGVLVQDFKYSGDFNRYRGWLNADSLGQVSFQLPVYLYLTLQRLAQEGYHLKPDTKLRLEYLLLKDPKRKPLEVEIDPSFLQVDQPNGLFDGIRRLLDTAVAGRFLPAPMAAPQTCQYCDYATLCRYWSSGAAAGAWNHGVEGAGES